MQLIIKINIKLKNECSSSPKTVLNVGTYGIVKKKNSFPMGEMYSYENTYLYLNIKNTFMDIWNGNLYLATGW